MTGPHDDLFDRLHAAADSVPPSTLDLPVVLVTSRRKATARRAATGTAVLTAFAVLGVGVASGLPSQVAHELVPAAAYETLSTEIAHREIAPGITAVAEAATYELPDKTVVLDTGIETGANGDRFLIVSTVEFEAGLADLEDGEIVDRSDAKDPARIQEMTELGYPPIETQRVQVVAGDDAELRRLQDGYEPTNVVVEDVPSVVAVEAGARRIVFATPLSKGTTDEADTYVTSWEPFEGADGTTVSTLLTPSLVVPERQREVVALEVSDESSFAPQLVLTFAAATRGAGGCSRPDAGCTVAYDPETGVATPSAAVDPRWKDPVDPVQLELNALVHDQATSDEVVLRCLELRGAADGLDMASLTVPNRRDRLGEDRDTMVRCEADEQLALFSMLADGS